MKTKVNKAKSWLINPLLSIALATFSCQPQSAPVPAALPESFKLTGRYAVASIQIDPPLREGQDVIAMFADSSGQSLCLSGTTIRFDYAGWVSFIKPAGCEQNDDLTQITGMHDGDKWSIDDNTLLVDHIGQTTQYGLSSEGDQVFLNRDIDKGYASSLDDNPSGYTVTIELKRF